MVCYSKPALSRFLNTLKIIALSFHFIQVVGFKKLTHLASVCKINGHYIIQSHGEEHLGTPKTQDFKVADFGTSQVPICDFLINNTN